MNTLTNNFLVVRTRLQVDHGADAKWREGPARRRSSLTSRDYFISAAVLLSTPLVTTGCAGDIAPADASAAVVACRLDKGSHPPPTPAVSTPPALNEIDWKMPSCTTGTLPPPTCPSTTTVEFTEETAAPDHIPLPQAITYAQSPPTSGPHRFEWAKWGEFVHLPAQRWLHNLEHGGVALLYHPCADPKIIQQLRGFARCQPAGKGGDPFRWVMSPYPDLETQWTIVAWKWRISGNCFDPAAVGKFLDQHYNKSSEDVPNHGSWNFMYMGL